jgi:hypothetical protein
MRVRSRVERRARGRVRVLAGVIILAVAAVAGCNELPEPVPLPCEPPAFETSLGRPVRSGNTRPGEEGVPLAAWFTTTGGPVWFMTPPIPEGGFVVGRGLPSGVSIGSGPEIPTFADQYAPLVPAPEYEMTLVPTQWQEIEIAPGRYWVVKAGFENLFIATCEEGVITDTEPSPSGTEEFPCDGEGVVVDLGEPNGADRAATLRITDGILWFYSDPASPTPRKVWLGDPDDPPRFDPATDTVSPTPLRHPNLGWGQYAPNGIRAGTYAVVTQDPGHLIVVACDPGVIIAAEPAPD